MTEFTTQPPRPQAIGGQGDHTTFDGLQAPYPGFLPSHGIFVSVGGMTTQPRRVMMNCETGHLMAGAAEKTHGSALEPMPLTVNRDASDDELARMSDWIDQLLALQEPAEQPVHSADAQHALIAVKDGQAFQLLCFGPITEGLENEVFRHLLNLGTP